MTFTNKFKDLKKFYTIFIIIILFFNTALISSLHANSFKISDIEVSQDFNLDFNKKKVFDEAFKAAYAQLISTIITSKDKKKIEKINLSTIKSLIDSFNVSDEKFFENKYYATINVNFNKKNESEDFDKAAEDLRLATRHLGMIVGKVEVEEILGSIFNDFCIGK